MEGLLIAEVIKSVAPKLPAKRLGWRFPDAHTFVLPLAEGALWLYLKPPQPLFAYRQAFPSPGPAQSNFQELLVARAVGALLALEQHKLDRVLTLHFAESVGFVSSPAVKLVAELTGRNANLVLLDEEGVILGVMREVSREVNRFRALRPGLVYKPPPPYQKLDLRSASDEELTASLEGKRLKDLSQVLDGIGPQLSGALAAHAGLSPGHVLKDMPRIIALLRRLAQEPSRMLAEVASLPNIDGLRQEQNRRMLLDRLKDELGKKERRLARRLDDIARAREAAKKADELRGQGDLLLAYAHEVPTGAAAITLPDFAGREVTLELDPRLSAIENAQAFYERAKKRALGLAQAEAREEALREELAEITALLPLEDHTLSQLEELAERYLPQEEKEARREPGIRYTSPQGFRILVGRNARENDFLTFKLARSLDVWLHVQGYHGAHVIVHSEGREVPFETILYAAQLAAGYSQAAKSDNVAVDYTLKKNVWRPKGGAPGAAHYSQQKTVYVTPNRHPA